MPNTQEMCNSAKREFLSGIHHLGTTVAHTGTAADALKVALYLDTATVNKDTTEYATLNEVADASYPAGGVAVTNANDPALDTDTAHWTPSDSVTFGTLTASNFDCALLYNDSEATKRAIAVFTFGSQTIVAGNFVLTMPVDDGSTGLIRLA